MRQVCLLGRYRTLQMIANGANLSDVLNDLCAAIDAHASATSFVSLLDGLGNQLLPIAGPRVPPAFCERYHTLAHRSETEALAALRRL